MVLQISPKPRIWVDSNNKYSIHILSYTFFINLVFFLIFTSCKPPLQTMLSITFTCYQTCYTSKFSKNAKVNVHASSNGSSFLSAHTVCATHLEKIYNHPEEKVQFPAVLVMGNSAVIAYEPLSLFLSVSVHIYWHQRHYILL